MNKNLTNIEQDQEEASTDTERRKTCAPSPEANPGWLKLYKDLDETEKTFVREALKDGELDRAAQVARFRNAFELLGRTKVRRVLLLAASFSETNLAVKLAKPFVMERLITSAVEGETSAVKLFLSLEIPEKKKKVNYGKSLAEISRSGSEGRLQEEHEEPGDVLPGSSSDAGT
jgi:hypothetical protein